jgi:ferredoxin
VQRLLIDEDMCHGHGRCYAVSPDLFNSDDEGFGVVVGSEITDADRESADRAMSNCPEQAISIVNRE